MKQGGAGLGTRREGSGEDATLEELGKRELRSSIGECDYSRIASVAGWSVLHGRLHAIEVYTRKAFRVYTRGSSPVLLTKIFSRKVIT